MRSSLFSPCGHSSSEVAAVTVRQPRHYNSNRHHNPHHTTALAQTTTDAILPPCLPPCLPVFLPPSHPSRLCSCVVCPCPYLSITNTMARTCRVSSSSCCCVFSLASAKSKVTQTSHNVTWAVVKHRGLLALLSFRYTPYPLLNPIASLHIYAPHPPTAIPLALSRVYV